MSDQLRAIRNMVVGVALVAGCIYMILWAGHLKKVYIDWVSVPRQQHTRADQEYAARNWKDVQAFQQNHPLLWEIAPFFPPYGILNKDFAYSWPFFQLNWRFFAYLLLGVSSAMMVASGLHLQGLIDQLNHEDKLERMRAKRRGGVPVASGQTLIEIKNEIQVQASETGKWYSVNGAIVGGTIASILAPVILKLFGFHS